MLGRRGRCLPAWTDVTLEPPPCACVLCPAQALPPHPLAGSPPHLDHHHVPDRCCRMRCTRGGRFSRWSNLFPFPRPDVENVHVVRSARQPDACGRIAHADAVVDEPGCNTQERKAAPCRGKACRRALPDAAWFVAGDCVASFFPDEPSRAVAPPTCTRPGAPRWCPHPPPSAS